ncbi:4'-phosphopantetheinyl transferase superfamily protein [Planomonospora sp. ID91781]|uniref:4'-phosphopantetheinyl transferase family protein n=1 Tax=Planomonospora sp. ID91781 TaxID=2738135 RepID=UPI0018C3F09C|nr:4'-phosphopantetheinyl transferase superfamily protein [Planomonospora sp. ID91781]MBG0823481.1 4'-phosphopantetheinyl transferase superfamily protein [Planomonospora sp. ID91781]
MSIPVLRRSECHVWWADTGPQPVGELAAVLGAVEAERAARLHREEDRRRFVTACWLLRTVVGAQLGVAAAAVRVHRRCPDCGGPHGRPRILDAEEAADRLHVSVSHAGDRVAVAVCPSAPVGVDVEPVASAPVTRAATSPAEWAALRVLPPYGRRAGFARLWVRKEAALKATGHGLRIPPDRVTVSGPLEPPALVDWPIEVSPAEVELHTLDPGDGYVGALAVLPGGRAITVSESDATDLHRTAGPAPVGRGAR